MFFLENKNGQVIHSCLKKVQYLLSAIFKCGNSNPQINIVSFILNVKTRKFKCRICGFLQKILNPFKFQIFQYNEKIMKKSEKKHLKSRFLHRLPYHNYNFIRIYYKL